MLHRHSEREMRHAGITGFLQDPGQTQLRIIANITDAVAVEDKRMGVHHAIRLDNPLLERGHDHQRFDGRPGFEGVADGAVAEIIQRRAVAIVRIEVRVAGHRQNLTGINFDQYRRPGFRLIPANGIIQRIFGHRLQTFINTQLQIMRRDWRHFGNIFNNIAMFIFAHQASSGFAGQLGIKAFLHPFDALIIDIGKAQQIGSHMTSRIETSRFIAQIDAREMQFINPLRLLRIDLTRQIEKTGVRMTLYPLGQLTEVEMQCFGHCLPARTITNPTLIHGGLRVDPDSADRYAHRQRSSFAVANHAALHRHRLFAQRTHVFLFYQVIGRDNLQPAHAGQQQSQTTKNGHTE